MKMKLAALAASFVLAAALVACGGSPSSAPAQSLPTQPSSAAPESEDPSWSARSAEASSWSAMASTAGRDSCGSAAAISLSWEAAERNAAP